jgi:ATP-dependent DNA ligase
MFPDRLLGKMGPKPRRSSASQASRLRLLVLKSACCRVREPYQPGSLQPCLPNNAPCPPSGALWLHEIKHDGFRVIARKDGERMRLYSCPGNDLTRQ